MLCNNTYPKSKENVARHGFSVKEFSDTEELVDVEEDEYVVDYDDEADDAE